MLERMCATIIKKNRYEMLAKDEIERIHVLLAHDAAMGAQSSHLGWVTHLLDEESQLLGDTGYCLLGRKEKSLSFDLAVQHNSLAITASIREDFVAGTHPGAILFPLLWAEAERKTYKYQKLIESAAIGFKLTQFLNAQLGKRLAEKGFRATTVIGAVASAGALAWLKEESLDHAMKAMAVATSSVSGFAFPFQAGTEEWLFQVPLAAHLANMACRNAKSMSFNNVQYLTGEYSLGGFLDLLPFEDEGEEPDLLKIGVKRHPVNSFVQPVVEAILRIKDINPEEIRKVTVNVPETFKAIPVLNHRGPFEKPNLALLSIPVSAALTLLHQGISFEDLKKANDPSTLALAEKIEIVFTSELSLYDVNVSVKSNDNLEYSSQVKTSFFYPSLKEEMEWIEQGHTESLEWVKKIVKNWKSL